MKMEKSVVFPTTDVRAILGGRKTQFRIAVKPKYSDSVFEMLKGVLYETEPPTPPKKLGNGMTQHKVRCFVECKPRYQPGDILWVRETWALGKIDYGENEHGDNESYVSQCVGENDYIYKEYVIRHDMGMDDVVWKPSIHMPRAAARIFLRVTDVRIERVQDITPNDCIAEGLNELAAFRKGYCLKWGCRHDCAALENNCFVGTWDNLNAKRGYGWGINPWVFVYTFEKIDNYGGES